MASQLGGMTDEGLMMMIWLVNVADLGPRLVMVLGVSLVFER